MIVYRARAADVNDGTNRARAARHGHTRSLAKSVCQAIGMSRVTSDSEFRASKGIELLISRGRAMRDGNRVIEGWGKGPALAWLPRLGSLTSATGGTGKQKNIWGGRRFREPIAFNIWPRSTHGRSQL